MEAIETIITPPARRSFFRRKAEPTPADKVLAKLDRIEQENERSVKMDHRFGAIAVVTIAAAAMIGMSAESITHFFAKTAKPIDAISFVIAFVAVIVMNRGLLAAARNIRRAESRGEAASQGDQRTLYGVMLMEALSFGYMLSTFEHPSTFIQWALLVGRAVVLPYATVYLEQQREMPIDPQDIGIQTEIASGMGVLRDFVMSANDRAVPTALKVAYYQASATLTPEQDRKLTAMQTAAQVYEQFKVTGQISPVPAIQLVDKQGAPLATKPPPTIVQTPPDDEKPKGKTAKPKTKPSERNIVTPAQYQKAVELLTANPKMSVRTLAATVGIPASTMLPHMKEINATIAANKKRPGPVRMEDRTPAPDAQTQANAADQ